MSKLHPREAAIERLCAQVGYALRCARLHRLRTISSVAKAVGVSSQYLRRIESGQVEDLSLCLISNICFELQFEPVEFELK